MKFIETITQYQKEELFNKVIQNNASNRFAYNQLRQTLWNNESLIVPFVGAGLSRFAYKGWGELLQDLLVLAPGDFRQKVPGDFRHFAPEEISQL